jgi:hypothetical protein
VVFNGTRPNVEAILTRIREEYGRWRPARLFCSDSFGFVEPVSWITGEWDFELEELPPLVGSRLPVFSIVPSIG